MHVSGPPLSLSSSGSFSDSAVSLPLETDSNPSVKIILKFAKKHIREDLLPSYQVRLPLFLCARAGNPGILQSLLPAGQDKNVTDRIFDFIRKMELGVKPRVMQLYRPEVVGICDLDMLTHAQRLHIALFAAKQQQPSAYFKKSVYGLPKSLVIASKGLYVLSKSEVPKKSTYKKVTSGCLLEKGSNKVVRIAQAVNRTVYKQDGTINLEEMRDTVATNIQDAAYQKKFYDLAVGGEGIWPPGDTLEYSKQKVLSSNKIVEVPKFMQLPIWGTVLTSYLHEKTSLKERLEIVRRLTVGLCAIHNDGYLHGDLKPDNVIDDREKSGMNDFGYCFESTMPLEEQKSFLDIGFYGSIIPTAPEVFGVHGFSGDIFAVERFAFGYLVYYIMNGEYPPWSSLLTDAFVANRNAVPNLMKEAFKRAIKIVVEEHLEKFASEPCPTTRPM